jgi:glycosyltransferase involved in cell wall biosynthesis
VRALVDAHHLGLSQTGNETWVRNVLAGLSALDGQAAAPVDDLHVAVTRAGLPEVAEHVRASNTHVVSASSSRRLAVDLPLVLHSVRPDALLVQYTLPPLCRTPSVVVVHDLSFERPEASQWIPRASLLRYRRTIRASARRARRVLVPSAFTKADLVERYRLPESSVIVAGNALDPELAAALRAVPRVTAPDRLVVLAVGTVLPRKNLEVVAAAVAVLRDKGLPVVLRLVGPTPPAGRAALARMSDLLGEGLEVLGQVSTADLAAAYRCAQVLAFPSLFEGFGIPLVEAMAAGTPVVSSDATCLPEVGGSAVLYAAPTDVEAWVDALHLVLTDAATAARLADTGRAQAATFDWSVTAAAVAQALAEAAA